MKTIKALKLILPLFAITLSIMIFNSCKKSKMDVSADQKTDVYKSPQDIVAASIKAIKDKYGNISGSVISPVNKDPKNLFYRNANGEMTKIVKSNNNNAYCTYTCSTTNDPNALNLVYTLTYIQRNYLCESGPKSNLNVNWTISVPFTPFTTYGLSTSTGTLKVTDPTSTLHTFSGLPITIRSLGSDATCAVNTLYEITYQATNIPDSYFGAGMSMDASLSLYNDCGLLGNLVTTGDVTASDVFLTAEYPCNRVDKAYVNPNLGPSSCATIAGAYILCTNPSGFLTIDNHEVEYRLIDNFGTEWDDQSSIVFWGEPVFTGTPNEGLNPNSGVSNLVNMTPSSGTWLVRYRNVKTSICGFIYSSAGNSFPGPINANGYWGSKVGWFVEVWPL